MVRLSDGQTHRYESPTVVQRQGSFTHGSQKPALHRHVMVKSLLITHCPPPPHSTSSHAPSSSCVSHVGPLKERSQRHSKPPSLVSTHSPPFWQGFVAQGLSGSYWQRLPAEPEGHAHVKGPESPITQPAAPRKQVSSQVPPFRHGLGSQPWASAASGAAPSAAAIHTEVKIALEIRSPNTRITHPRHRARTPDRPNGTALDFGKLARPRRRASNRPRRRSTPR